MNTKRGLGRGLGELLSQTGSSSAHSSDSPPQRSPTRIAIEKLKPSRFQPRRDFDEDSLYELSQSIRAHGIIQPIAVRATDTDEYEIIAGERRWRAAQMARLENVPVVIHAISDDDAMAFALIENIQRQDLNAIEQALAIKRLLDEFSMTHQQLAETLGKSRTSITNLLRLLQLHDQVKLFLERGDIEVGHAKLLVTLAEDLQLRIAQQVVAQGLSVRATEKLIQNLAKPESEPVGSDIEDADLARLTRELSEKLCTKVNIKHKKNGAGSIVIHYYSLDELDGLLEKF